MIDTLAPVLRGIWYQDFGALMAVNSTLLIYMVIVAFIGLESALLPAAPLPCDSVVVLAGSLAALGVLDGFIMFPLLIVAAALGSWLAFYQGTLLKNHSVGVRWMSKIPKDKRNVVDRLLAKNVLLAMFLARFMPVVRTLLPMVLGAFKEHKSTSLSFPFISVFSAVMWVSVLMGCGYLISLLPEVLARFITMGLVAMPVISLVIAVLTGFVWLIRQSGIPTFENNKRK